MRAGLVGSWMRRNAVALAVTLVAAVALVGVVLIFPLYQNAQFQPAPVEVAEGDSTEAAGYTWRLVTSEEFPPAATDGAVPDGLALTAAIIEVRPGDDPQDTGSCSAELTEGFGPEARRWTTLGNPYEFNYEPLDETTTTCLLEGEPFDLEVIYLTPEGTISDAVVEVEVGVLGGELIRFALTD